MTTESLVERIQAIYDRQRGKIRRDLTGIAHLDKALGFPSRQLRTVVVAGTNGKGTCARTIEAIARAHGLRTGLFTSPHLSRLNQRFRIDGLEVSDDLLERSIQRVDDGRVTFFELSTALAFDLFARERVGLAVLEVGMGGRWDAVNHSDPEVSVVTSVALDHQEYLGETLEQIAGEKLAVARRSRPLVLGPRMEAYRNQAEATGANLWLNGKDWSVDRTSVRSVSVIAQRPETIQLDMLWDAVATGVAASTCLGLHEQDAVQQGLDRLRHPMRGERVGGLLMDAAHNEAAVTALAGEISHSVDALVSLCSRHPRVLAPILPVVRRVYVLEADHPKAVPGTLISDVLQGLGAEVALVSRDEALALMAEAVGKDQLSLVAFGSIYGLGPLRDALMGVDA